MDIGGFGTDIRTYHVPVRYKSYMDMSPSKVLADIRQGLIKQYQTIASGKAQKGSGSKDEAKILQDFFLQLKQMTSKQPSQNPITRFETALMNNVIAQAIKLSGGKFKNVTGGREWFQMAGGKDQGFNFEQELAAIVGAVANMTGGSFHSMTELMVGGQDRSVNVGGVMYNELKSMVQQIGENWIKNIDDKMVKSGKDLLKGQNRLVTVNVSGKIDVMALTSEYTFIPTVSAEFNTVAQLLKTATFTAKSYRSMIYDIEKKLPVASKTTELHLGGTNTNRILLDMVMRYGQLPYPVAASFVYKTLNSFSKSNTGLYEEMSRLRWIYELTGYGQTYLDTYIQKQIEKESGMGAKYLIYNDPSTNNIYVRSTADLVQEIMRDFIGSIKNGSSVISKSRFQ